LVNRLLEKEGGVVDP